jgi:DNA primase
MAFTQEIIAEIRNRANLVEVISEYVPLKRAGKEYKGLCPFHTDKHPSFYVNPDKGIYKCFSCGEGGHVIGFIQKIKKIEFKEAVRELAQRYNVQLVETAEARQEYDKRSLFWLLYEQTAAYFARMLSDGREGAIARDYLLKRGIDEDLISRFKLGFAPQTWDGLLNFLTESNKVTPATLEEAGLVRRKQDSNSFYDLFRNRLMIPICDDQGRVVAFGGRVLGDEQPKYINSPESLVYTKGQHLFALNLAKETIKERDSVIVMEGYFDVITAHQFGFKQAVATLGTAMTDRQAKLLMRYTDSKRIYLCFDADPAGVKAVERGVETLNQIAEGIGVELRVIKVPGGKDADECLRSTGPDGGEAAFTQSINQAPLLIDYRLELSIGACNLTSHTGRIEAARNVVPILAGIKNSVARGEYIRQWAPKLRLREDELLADVSQYRRAKGLTNVPLSIRASGPSSRSNLLKSGYMEAEKQLLALYLLSFEDNQLAKHTLEGDQFIDPLHQRLKTALDQLSITAEEFDLADKQFLNSLTEDPEATRAAVDLILKAEEMNEQKTPVDVILSEGRARVLKEKANLEKTRLRTLLNLAKTDEEQGVLQSKIVELKQLETILLPGCTSEEDLNQLKAKVEDILRVSSQYRYLEHQQVETPA